MAQPIIYLDVDDEITTAAARIRASDAGRIAVVIPPGSRIATSRMNFRLLAREAAAVGKDLAVVAPDAASRALAASAGLATHGSVAEFEAAIRPPGEEPGPGEGPGPEAGAAAAAASAAALAGARAAGPGEGTTPEAAGSTASDVVVRRPAVPTPPREELKPRSAATTSVGIGAAGRQRRGLTAVAVVGGLLVAGALVVGGVAGYLLLPAATVTVTPRVTTAGPVALTVRADPAVDEVDVEAGVVPAERIPLPVQAQGSYEATGQRVEESAASGEVRWKNCDPTASHTIPQGAIVRTASGIQFRTAESVFLPVAILDLGSGSLQCQERDVGVSAAQAGPEGNVPAGAITRVPGNVNSVVISVTNPGPTTGGARKTFPVVTAADITRATADLDAKLAAAFQAALADPASAPPGQTVFAETGTLGAGTLEPDPAGIVGQEIATFELAASATGEVTAVDETTVTAVAADRLEAAVDTDHILVEGSTQVVIGQPVISGAMVEFPVSATGQQSAILDPAELEPLVLGKTPDEAVAALAPYGTAVVELSPDWAATIPTYDFRVEVVIEGGATPEPNGSSTPEPEPSATPTLEPSVAPEASPDS